MSERFPNPAERSKVVGLDAIREWRAKTGRGLRAYFQEHDVCFECKGLGVRIVGWRGTATPNLGPCEFCKQSGRWCEPIFAADGGIPPGWTMDEQGRHMKPCPNCCVDAWIPVVDCADCGGFGMVPAYFAVETGLPPGWTVDEKGKHMKPCPTCCEDAWIPSESCATCDGMGMVPA